MLWGQCSHPPLPQALYSDWYKGQSNSNINLLRYCILTIQVIRHRSFYALLVTSISNISKEIVSSINFCSILIKKKMPTILLQNFFSQIIDLAHLCIMLIFARPNFDGLFCMFEHLWCYFVTYFLTKQNIHPNWTGLYSEKMIYSCVHYKTHIGSLGKFFFLSS